MTRRSIIKSLIEEQLATANSGAEQPVRAAPPSRMAAGPVRAMGLTLDKIEDEARALKDALATGQAVVELPPALVDASFVSDRFDPVGDEAFEALKTSLRDHGQEVPVLVRPHPLAEGRFQLAYGHRRWRAAKELGLPLRAVVKSIDDQALILAQGLENSARRDLSYIERAMFGKALEDRGIDRAVIMVALSTDKTELSKMISVARAVPESVARLIGPAPKAGRRRWLELAELLRDRKSIGRAEQVLAAPDATVDTDARFLRVLRELSKAAPKPRANAIWTSATGKRLADVIEDEKRTAIRFEPAVPKEFAGFVAGQLDRLFEDFQRLKRPD